MRLVAILCLAASCCLLAGCGEPPPLIKVGSAPAGDHRASIAPAAADGLTPFSAWPRACQFITEGDIKTIMPQASGISHKGYDSKFNLILHPYNGTYTVTGAGCKMTWWLPGAEKGTEVPTASLDLEFTAVGRPDVGHENFPSTRSLVPDPAAMGADECAQSVQTYVCRRQGVNFELSWVGAPPIKRYEGQGNKVSADQFWHDRVAVEFVKVVTGKLP